MGDNACMQLTAPANYAELLGDSRILPRVVSCSAVRLVKFPPIFGGWRLMIVFAVNAISQDRLSWCSSHSFDFDERIYEFFNLSRVASPFAPLTC